jgi:hypothetical protein
MEAQFKAWTVALACSALVLIVTPASIAQATSKGTMQEEITKQQNLMSEGSQKVTDASKTLQEAMRILETKQDYAKARQMITEADKTMADGEKLLTDAQRIDASLLQEIRKTGEAGRKMMQGARLIRNGITMMMKDERALSRAHKITREGQGLLERSQMIVTAPQL